MLIPAVGGTWSAWQAANSQPGQQSEKQNQNMTVFKNKIKENKNKPSHTLLFGNESVERAISDTFGFNFEAVIVLNSRLKSGQHQNLKLLTSAWSNMLGGTVTRPPTRVLNMQKCSGLLGFYISTKEEDWSSGSVTHRRRTHNVTLTHQKCKLQLDQGGELRTPNTKQHQWKT